MCPVCANEGWVQAAPVNTVVTFDGSVSVVQTFTPTPCFCCYPHNIKVLIP